MMRVLKAIENPHTDIGTYDRKITPEQARLPARYAFRH